VKPQVARTVLRGLSIGYLGIYLFVLFVALATSGDELLRSPGAWYAALAPLLYVGLAGSYAFGLTKQRIPVGIAVALHLLVAPAFVFSFLGLGLLLPIFSVLWWFIARKQIVAAA
jgi:hypothetical protein